jgi:hypothetical protein
MYTLYTYIYTLYIYIHYIYTLYLYIHTYIYIYTYTPLITLRYTLPGSVPVTGPVMVFEVELQAELINEGIELCKNW